MAQSLNSEIDFLTVQCLISNTKINNKLEFMKQLVDGQITKWLKIFLLFSKIIATEKCLTLNTKTNIKLEFIEQLLNG